ncbi:MAG: TraB/GumN family protein [Gammaproteobacteria bacterium]|nr:TraB/GumN family protein [Gammaproteobacteria bacterium]NNF62424.1 TraB/GumN family protein [Gammaproteobacteria bacterium]NNM20164.1 TraB/GumN family protein [Gammaproteobacteria bacterium]
MTEYYRTISVAVVALLVLAGGCSPDNSDDVPNDAGEHIVWEVQGESNSVFLLGSIHLLRPQDYPLPEVYDEVYAEAEQLVMELDMDDLDVSTMQREMMTAAMIDNGSLRDLLGEEAWNTAARTAAGMDIELEMLGAVEPWFAALTVVELQMVKMGFNPALGVEFYFLERARNDDKPITGLETIGEQIAFFDEMPIDTQRRFLLKTLDDASKIGTDIDALVGAWRSGDLAAMRGELTRGFDGFPQVYNSLVAARNAGWLEDITDLLDDEDDYLVIVGALHLVGEDSLVKLLDEQGFQLNRR